MHNLQHVHMHCSVRGMLHNIFVDVSSSRRDGKIVVVVVVSQVVAFCIFRYLDFF
jgi:hypothetical protein